MQYVIDKFFAFLGNARLQKFSSSATTHAKSYASYIRMLGEQFNGECKDETTALACRQLIANVFAIYIAQLTTGMRIGSR